MGIRVIVIDDDSSILFSLEAYLEDCGYTVYTASNGEDGIKLIAEQDADIVITDMHMPIKSGMDVIQSVNETKELLPVIVLSGNGVAEGVIEALRAGAWDYILKPIRDFSILTLTIERMLERRDLLIEKKKYQESLEDTVSEQNIELKQKNIELEKYQVHLEEIIVERTQALAKTQNLLIESAHKAGQADIAIDVIHNIGNSMNSINTAIYVLEKELNSLPTDKLRDTCTLMQENSGDLYDFLVTQKKATTLINYLSSIEESFSKTTSTMVENQQRIVSKTSEVNEILNSYRKFIDDENISSMIEINSIVENTLEIYKKNLDDENVDITIDMPAKQYAKSSKEILIDLLLKVLQSIIAIKTLDDERKGIHFTLQSSAEETILIISAHNLFIPENNLKSILLLSFGNNGNVSEIDAKTYNYTILNWNILVSQKSDTVITYTLSIQQVK